MDILLNDKWRVNFIPYGEDLSEILKDNFVPEGWLCTQVPQEIHGVLRKAGYLQGQVYDKAVDAESWIEEVDWIYYKEFYAAKEIMEQTCFLRCEGLDTFCDIYLNGTLLGRNENMFVPFEKPLAGVVRPGARNVLILRFYSAVNYVKGQQENQIFSITTSDRIFARKAQMNYSWDFCGRTVTAGIWKNIGIRIQKPDRILSYYLYTKEIADKKGILGLQVETETTDPGCQLQIRLFKNGEEKYQRLLTPQEAEETEIELDQPELWWPHSYGKPELYDFELTLISSQKIVDSRKQKLGIRTVRLLMEKQEDGQSFQFEVNGRRIFVRGANWVPMKTIYTDIRDEDYDSYLQKAVRGNIDMLRIWGGGIYEKERMYEVCDELGIMVWNDFMFACGIYPQEPRFLELVEAEAREVIAKYRNYTSLVIWAGDNENGQAYGWAGRPYEFSKDKIGNEVLKKICEELDPQRCYIPTSPCSPEESIRGGDDPSSPYQGDQHIYIMSADPGKMQHRDYGKNYYKRILGYRPRFVSEFGFISLPEKETFYRYHFLRTPLTDTKELVEFLPMCRKYLDRQEYDQAIYYSQLFNAMALKYWIEYFRSLKGTCWGTLYWKFNDPLADKPLEGVFPSHMCSVDMYGNTKMTYDYTRRAYEDFLIAAIEQDHDLNIYACNETLEDKEGVLSVKEMRLNGRVIFEKQVQCVARKDCSTLLCQIPKEILQKEEERSRYMLLQFRTGEENYQNRYFYLTINENDTLSLEQTRLIIGGARWKSKKRFEIELRAETFIRGIRLNLLDTEVAFSDNYFDMDANETKVIEIVLLEEYELEEVQGKALYTEAENCPREILPLYLVE